MSGEPVNEFSGLAAERFLDEMKDETMNVGRFCMLCDEPIKKWDAWAPVNPHQVAHNECTVRSAVGGIGHLLAHPYWCTEMHDPDAGLSYRQSANMVAVLIDLLGIEEVARRGVAM